MLRLLEEEPGTATEQSCLCPITKRASTMYRLQVGLRCLLSGLTSPKTRFVYIRNSYRTEGIFSITLEIIPRLWESTGLPCMAREGNSCSGRTAARCTPQDSWSIFATPL